jgi:hypothetical protein
MTVLCLTVSLTVRLIYPKLALIWSGEKVVISQLLKDHKDSKASQRGAAARNTNHKSTPTTTTTLPYATSQNGPSKNSTNGTDIAAMRARVSQATSSNIDEQANQTNSGDVRKEMEPIDVEGHARRSSFAKHDATKSVTFQRGQTVSNQTQHHDGTPPPTAGGGGFHEEEERGEHATTATLLPPLVIRESAAPPRKVTVGLLELIDIASHVKTRILSGLQVKQKDWEDLRTGVAHMNQTFCERVQFDWEEIEPLSTEDMA